ncbi:MAG: hypothetical protein JWQ43_1981 [Glaciihabitans sp.]|nr:hypothetical protein [Glaciihabitans sp.]
MLKGTTVERIAAPLRVALVEDHELVRIGIAKLLSEQTAVELVAATATVAELELLEASPAVVLLDLRLADGSSPGDNVTALRELGAETLILSAGDDPRLVRLAARAGVLGVLRKGAPAAEVVDALVRAGAGETIAGTDWAAALDADMSLADANLDEDEREILALYASGENAPSVALRTGLSNETVARSIGHIRAKYFTGAKPGVSASVPGGRAAGAMPPESLRSEP